MNTDKKHIKNLAKICAAKGMQHVVLSPGSRCAPLVIAFNRTEGIECLSVTDERSAAFFALGIAQQTQQPVGLVCTSGSAILNYAPALAEAYYQKIPLVVMTADRPNEWIDQGENQSIQQFEVYKNYIKKSFQLPVQIKDDKDLWFSDRMVSEAINSSLYPDFGPVHINVPLREPLYNLVEDEDDAPKLIHFPAPSYSVETQAMNLLKDAWKAAPKKLIVVGSRKKRNKDIEKELQELAKSDNVVILKESISNVYGDDFIDSVDSCIEIISQKELSDFTPDIVLTFGGSVVSKKLKFWLRNNNPSEHWHITKSFEHWDNFQSLSTVIQADALPVLKALNEDNTKTSSNYKKLWLNLSINLAKLNKAYLKSLAFTDFKVYDFLVNKLPNEGNIHLGNSTPVRYINLLQVDSLKNLTINSNRGVSGIDGVSSTAAGSSYINGNKPTVVITGDVAFLYDSNALWNGHLKANFKIVLINNGGGNIFKIIPGPDQLEELPTFFETKQDINVKPLCEMFNIAYYSAGNMNELEKNWNIFMSNKEKPALIEINTPSEESATGLRGYFQYLTNEYKEE